MFVILGFEHVFITINSVSTVVRSTWHDLRVRRCQSPDEFRPRFEPLLSKILLQSFDFRFSGFRKLFLSGSSSLCPADLSRVCVSPCSSSEIYLNKIECLLKNANISWFIFCVISILFHLISYRVCY
jgi:hypothetical protein